MAVFEAEKNGVLLTNDPSKVNLEDVCDLIEKQYWGPSRVRRTTKKAFENSYSFVLLKDGALVGCARVVTDFVTCAYIEDVVVEDSLRGLPSNAVRHQNHTQAADGSKPGAGRQGSVCRLCKHGPRPGRAKGIGAKWHRVHPGRGKIHAAQSGVL